MTNKRKNLKKEIKKILIDVWCVACGPIPKLYKSKYLLPWIIYQKCTYSPITRCPVVGRTIINTFAAIFWIFEGDVSIMLVSFRIFLYNLCDVVQNDLQLLCYLCLTLVCFITMRFYKIVQDSLPLESKRDVLERLSRDF